MQELGIRYSGLRIVPRRILAMRGVTIQGDVEGVDYACLACRVPVHRPHAPSSQRL